MDIGSHEEREKQLLKYVGGWLLKVVPSRTGNLKLNITHLKTVQILANDTFDEALFREQASL